jgi:hypothetical protein
MRRAERLEIGAEIYPGYQQRERIAFLSIHRYGNGSPIAMISAGKWRYHGGRKRRARG